MIAIFKERHPDRPAHAGIAAARRYDRPRLPPTLPTEPADQRQDERWIQTILSERLYVEVFHSPDTRRLALARFIGCFNAQCPHLAGRRTDTGGSTRRAAGRQAVTNLARDYT